MRHVFQNGEPTPMRLLWLDPQGNRVDLGVIAPAGYRSIQTYVGHAFALIDPAGRCAMTVRIDDVLHGTFVGTSRYRPVEVRPGWHVFVDQALDPATRPARAAFATLAGKLAKTEAALPPASLAQVRSTPIFLHDHAGPGSMFHYDAGWLIAHGRTVELVDAIEVSDAEVFVDTVKTQPSAVLHELAHSYHARLSQQDRADIVAAYNHAIASRLYLGVKRNDGSIVNAYARQNAQEYFAELSEAYFGRNDFFPFTRADLARYDPEGERLIARLWR
ncbi:hypothetical protein [Sphingomonas sp. EC-HK361]|uniref:hypothetical protein n=1 Tax=Sphingomonas sp. EC-HK361 TaxID=2038397 RepID=UPI0018FE28DC|nr:hypothetical protein [Sphingomonas sp. EC-HK361]